MKRPIVLAGVRPTERMNLGHLIGFLKHLLDRQADARCFFNDRRLRCIAQGSGTSARDRTQHSQACHESSGLRVRSGAKRLLSAVAGSPTRGVGDDSRSCNNASRPNGRSGGATGAGCSEAVARTRVCRFYGISAGGRAAVPAFDRCCGPRSADALESVPGSSASIQSQIRDRLSSARVPAERKDEWPLRKYRNARG